MSTTQERAVGAPAEARLLAIVAELSADLRPTGEEQPSITLDSALDRELGFDSLSLAELIVRLEDEFGVQLPEGLLGTAESPLDLLLALQGAPTHQRAKTGMVRHVAVAASEEAPTSAETLLEALNWHVQAHPDRPHVLLYEEADTPVTITYSDLQVGALALAAGLQERGVEKGDAVAIMLPTGRDYLFTFFATLLVGCVPVPIYPPARMSQLEDHLRRHIRILNNAEARILVTMEEARTIARLMIDRVETMDSVVTPAELSSDAGSHPIRAEPEDIAFLQYTSGSTGEPKGVVLTHANLVANIRAMGEAAAVSSSDVFVSWLPLYHDMGLIGAWLGSLYYGMTLVLMSPLTFLARPSRWLWAIHRHHGTLSAAPNFAYQLCVSRLTDTDLQGLDLSSWRMAFNGAEQVSPQTIRRFSERFKDYGLPPGAMAPVYGLAEAAVGLAFPPVNRGALVDCVDREALLSQGVARPASMDASDTLEFVACGQALPGYQIRVVQGGHELPDRHEGRVQFQGPSATSGYYRNPRASRGLFDGAWLDTGDLGYIAAGDIYITSRTKDLIVRGGRNIYPYEVEEAIGDLEGVRKGCVAMFGGIDPEAGTERVIVVAETRETDEVVLAGLRQAGMEIATRLLGMPPDEIILAPPHTVLKTSSGKIRRSAVRELYERGDLGQGSRAVWWQFTRLALASIGPHLRRLQNRTREAAYAHWARLIVFLVAPIVWLGAVALPSLDLRWRFTRGGIRLVLRLTGVKITTAGLERLPDSEPVVLVANHASYLDGPALIAALPDPLVIVAKSELGKRFIPRLLVQRLGMHLVERLDRIQGKEDARATIEVLREGRSLVFFPEGTLIRSPGLLPFHLGAFVAAAETGTPVYPLLIKGTRSILRGGEWHPRRAPIHIELGEPLRVDNSGWNAALALRDAARAQMLAALGEPDLSD
jgi:1-acyl-sn-glycerol-3-phosphate acyltransferase